MSENTDRSAPDWPDDPSALTPEAVDFVAVAHVLGNTCCWGGRSLKFYSLAQRALTVCKGVERIGGLGEEDHQRLALHALLGDAWRAWLPGAPDEREQGGSGKPSDKQERAREKVRRAVLEGAGLEPDLPERWSLALELTRLMAEGSENRDLRGAGIGSGAGGLRFHPLKERVRPMRPDRAAEQWLERFDALRSAVRRTAEQCKAEPATPATGGGT